MGARRFGWRLESRLLRGLSSDPSAKDYRWYGRRSARKLRPARKRLIENLLPKLRIVLPDSGEVEVQDLFAGPVDKIYMEIGFGAGEHLVRLAEQNPRIGFIGCEPFVNGVATLLSKIEAKKINNIRLYNDDIRQLIPFLPGAKITKIYILFNDPWPKTRHHRRRLTSLENIDAFARLLVDDGGLQFASDHMEFAAWTLERLLAHPAFEWTARIAADWRLQPADWVATRYEEKALLRGAKPAYFNFRRRKRE